MGQEACDFGNRLSASQVGLIFCWRAHICSAFAVFSTFAFAHSCLFTHAEGWLPVFFLNL